MTHEPTGVKSKHKIVMVTVAILFLLLALAAGFFFWKWLQLKNNPEQTNENTSQQIIREVSNIFELPTNEEPTVAKIQDKDKLRQQQFFDGAQNGDFILIYSDRKLALLYRQETKKLINVGPISMSETTTPIE
ncbi:MAG TPA: hypothetical protein VLA77_01155 [Candidatus Saccharimonadales bacterium]|nr:hypothetical protein [Candidatus Saccharimonadales bacterium]